MVHAQTGYLLEKPQHFFAFTPPVNHHGNSTHVHAVCCHEEKVTTHAIEFRQQHAHPRCTFWDIAIDSQEFFHCERKHQFVIQWRGIVHTSDVGATLHVGEFFTLLFHTGMQITNDGFAAKNFFTLEFQHQAQYTMRTWMLWPHVDDHGLLFVIFNRTARELCSVFFTHPQYRTNFTQYFFCSEFTA